MLYMPWRNEDEDLIHGSQTFEEKYDQLKDVILKNRCQYEFNSIVLDKALEELDDHNESDQYGGNVTPNAQHIDEQDLTIGQKASDLFGCFDSGRNKQHTQYDLLDDIGIFPRSSHTEQLVIKRMDGKDFRKLVRSLNTEQKLFFIMCCILLK